MISAAQGRVQGRQPAAVIDIGSNSVRLVVYEGVNRSPTVLFNEKILCGLGKGLAKTGKLNAKAVQSALRALRRFRALADQAGAVSLDVLATAAAREAENGSQFIREAEALLKEPIKVLTGREEAYFSALGIISGFHDPDGIAGDLGGGSLELVDVKGRQIGDGITLPLGGLRLQDMSDGDLNKATELARKHLASAKLLGNGKGRTFYAVGGTWRNLAKLHMSSEHYALHVMHHYEIPFEEAQRFLRRVAAGDVDNMNGIEDVSKNRRALLAYGAIALLETIKLMRPANVVFSALGVREGFLYSLLPESDQLEDPLISAAEEFAVLRARSPAYARELAEWSGEAFAALGINETEDEKRYRRAACLVADISWRAHPDYRGSQALNMISNASFIGIDHPGRAYIALANFFRHEGISNSVPDPELAAIATPRLLEYSKILAGIMRITYPFSASMAGVVPKLSWKTTAEGLELVIDKRKADLIGDVPEGRLQQLARLTGKNIRMVIS